LNIFPPLALKARGDFSLEFMNCADKKQAYYLNMYKKAIWNGDYFRSDPDWVIRMIDKSARNMNLKTSITKQIWYYNTRQTHRYVE